MSQNRRIFSRVKFETNISVCFENRKTDAKLVDISLKGALVQLKQKLSIKHGDVCHLDISLNNDEIVIRIDTELVFHKDFQYGFKFHDIGLDSMTHLRRLVELNIGDSDQIKKELFFLTST